ncbi:interleukin-13 receptor subunit alpha-1 isoform X1 [Archocentrus centrarchus]|uniref:interleukin-13 receptor subunit alpha-1 isoform X1 n=1 Tax=Archocentrus centrarchus TaxID=63155 RepID=UPI0011EA01E6|nr:uncharacterized protein LOC115775174 isoform X1 [Archocentrus centrarchus]
MTVARQFFIFLCAATITGFSCESDVQLPPPMNVTYKWDDPFNVNVSWKKPDNLPDNCTIKYCIWKGGKMVYYTQQNYYKATYFTEEEQSDNCNVSIQAVRGDVETCGDRKESKLVSITVKTTRPQTKLVTDFKCSLEHDRMKCSWRPADDSLKLKVSYRTSKEKDNIRACAGSSSHEENVCYLNISTFEFIYVLVEAETGLSTLRPEFETPLPDMIITESGSELILTIPHPGPAVGNCNLNYNICITECSKVKPCQIYTANPQLIPYNKNCEYKIKYSLRTDSYCVPVYSDPKVVFHGKNRTPDETLTVVAIVVPIILSACVILSCYCFRRHREIICPTMPDPSTIFKEMMMSGNKESKPAPENLYTPVPEPTEYVTLVTENSVLQQNA